MCVGVLFALCFIIRRYWVLLFFDTHFLSVGGFVNFPVDLCICESENVKKFGESSKQKHELIKSLFFFN